MPSCLGVTGGEGEVAAVDNEKVVPFVPSKIGYFASSFLVGCFTASIGTCEDARGRSRGKGIGRGRDRGRGIGVVSGEWYW